MTFALRDCGERVANVKSTPLGNFEEAFDLYRGICRQRGDTHGGSGMATLVAEGCDHQVGSAVEDLRSVEKVRRGIDKAAEPHDAHDLVEVADRSLDLSDEIDGAAAGGGAALFDGDAAAKFPLGNQLAFLVEANLAGHEKKIPGAHGADVICHRTWRLVQDDPLSRKPLFDGSCHVFVPFDVTSTRQ